MRLLLDTNIVLYYLSGHKKLLKLLNGNEIHLSFITVVELLSYPKIGKKEEKEIRKFFNECTIHSESDLIRNETIKIRKKYNLKLPDSFIASTSVVENIPLISADKVFSRVKKLQFIDYEI